MNFYGIFMMMLMLLGTMFVVSSNNWLGSWIGLELGLLSFIPMIYMDKNFFSSETMMKYFLVQSLSSCLLLFGLFMNVLLMNYFFEMLIFLSLAAKLGLAPFHLWLPSVMEGMSWFNCFIISSLLKLGPLMLINYLNLNFLLNIFSLISMGLGSFGGLNQSSLRKMMGYSSIFNMGIVILIIKNNILVMNYLLIYFFLMGSLMLCFDYLSVSYLNQLFFFTFNLSLKLYFWILILSLGGLPPTVGFFPKWMVIEYMILNNSIFLCYFMMMMTLLTLFFYLRLAFNLMVLSSCSVKWLIYSNHGFFTFVVILSFLGFWIILLLSGFN